MRAFQRHSGKELASLCAAAVPDTQPKIVCWGLSDMCYEIGARCAAAGECRLRPDHDKQTETNAGDISEADIPRILSPAEQYHRDNDARALRRQMDFPDTQEREIRRNGHG
jgi:hypothetical protein